MKKRMSFKEYWIFIAKVAAALIGVSMLMILIASVFDLPDPFIFSNLILGWGLVALYVTYSNHKKMDLKLNEMTWWDKFLHLRAYSISLVLLGFWVFTLIDIFILKA